MVKARINQSPASPRLFEHAWTWAAGDVIGWSSYFRVCTKRRGEEPLVHQAERACGSNRGRAQGLQLGLDWRKEESGAMNAGSMFIISLFFLFFAVYFEREQTRFGTRGKSAC